VIFITIFFRSTFILFKNFTFKISPNKDDRNQQVKLFFQFIIFNSFFSSAFPFDRKSELLKVEPRRDIITFLQKFCQFQYILVLLNFS
jgi:hypothetical protein